MKNTAHKNKDGNIALIVVVVVLVAVGIGFVLLQSKTSMSTQVSSLPPIEERVNPSPQSGNKVYVSKADPGTKLIVDEAELVADGYIYVYSDMAGKQTMIGKSQLLTAGVHNNVSITLTSASKDGDVIYVNLVNKDGAKVLDENENAIEMQRNVGIVMSHYENEY